MAVLQGLTNMLVGQEPQDTWEGRHRTNIDNEFQKRYGRMPTIQEREQLASFSGDINQVSNLLGGSPSPTDLYRNITLSPQAQQQRSTLADSIYGPQEQRVKNNSADAYKNAEGSYLQQQSNLGLLHSGGTDAGLQNINRNRADNEAEQLAQLALQRSNLSTTLLNNDLQTSNNLTQLGLGNSQLELSKVSKADALLSSPAFQTMDPEQAMWLLNQYGYGA